ncbi:MAG: universal stress protein [Longimicrobiales bacterium]
MIEHLIVPLDGSAFSEQVLPLAMRLAQASEADVHLVHVHVPRPPDMFLTEATLGVEGVDIGAWDDERREQSRAYLEQIAVGLRGENAPEIHTAWLEGGFEEEIDHYGASLESALILITSHGRTGLSRFWLGSATDALVRTTRLPVLVAHPDPEGDADTVLLPALDHILVPLDGSPESTSVLTPVAALARATGARITLFHVVSSDDLIGGPILPVLVRSLPESLERAREHLERRAETLRRSGLDVDVDVAHGQMPARAIAREAEERGVDLVAMSTHGYGGVRRVLLGSVTDKVLRGVALPLLLQRPD